MHIIDLKGDWSPQRKSLQQWGDIAKQTSYREPWPGIHFPHSPFRLQKNDIEHKDIIWETAVVKWESSLVWGAAEVLSQNV